MQGTGMGCGKWAPEVRTERKYNRERSGLGVLFGVDDVPKNSSALQ